jgi:hypothetical protein
MGLLDQTMSAFLGVHLPHEGIVTREGEIGDSRAECPREEVQVGDE